MLQFPPVAFVSAANSAHWGFSLRVLKGLQDNTWLHLVRGSMPPPFPVGWCWCRCFLSFIVQCVFLRLSIYFSLPTRSSRMLCFPPQNTSSAFVVFTLSWCLEPVIRPHLCSYCSNMLCMFPSFHLAFSVSSSMPRVPSDHFSWIPVQNLWLLCQQLNILLALQSFQEGRRIPVFLTLYNLRGPVPCC